MGNFYLDIWFLNWADMWDLGHFSKLIIFLPHQHSQMGLTCHFPCQFTINMSFARIAKKITRKMIDLRYKNIKWSHLVHFFFAKTQKPCVSMH
jgi:hypothetical protein